jgi:hypothetical protein
MNWCGSKKLKNVSESVILAYLEYKAKKLRNCDLFFNQKLLNVKVFFVLDCIPSPDKINVNPDFIESNYLTTCSNQNVKKTIKIYDGKQMVIHHQSCR